MFGPNVLMLNGGIYEQLEHAKTRLTKEMSEHTGQFFIEEHRSELGYVEVGDNRREPGDRRTFVRNV
jgi:hypothetical protein